MLYLILSIIIIGVTQGFILLEEELLIIMASIVWVDAAGKLIKELLINELEYKSQVIKDKYLWFLERKIDLNKYLITMYTHRKSLINWSTQLQVYVIISLVINSLQYFFNNYFILQRYDRNILLFNFGGVLIKELFSLEINTIGLILKENNKYLNKYNCKLFNNIDW